jgi:hypothetical protein
MPRLTYTLPALLAGAISLMTTPECSAQQVRRYRPNTPTVSPYLNLLRNDNDNAGGLPNYYALVRPQLQQQSINQQQRAVNQQQLSIEAQQAAALGSLSNQVQPLLTPTGKAGQFMTQGRGASFQNTSRYFPQQRGVARR